MIAAPRYRLRASGRVAYLCLILFLVAEVSTPQLTAQTDGATTSTAQPNDAYIQAKSAFERRDYSQAAKLFAQAESTAPGQTDALLFQGKSSINLGDFPDAQLALETYLAKNPKSSESLYLLGYVFQKEDKPKQSLEVFTRAAALQPPQSNDLKLVGLDYVLLGDYLDAVVWLTKAAEMDPRNKEAWYDLGRAQMTQGHFAEAEQAFSRVLALSPKDVKAENNLGLVYEAQNRTADALRAYEAAVAWQSASEHPSEQPLLNYGTLLISLARSANAIVALESATRLAPHNAVCHEQLARAYLQAGNLEGATAEMSRATQIDPSNSRFHYELGRIYRRAGLKERAAKELELSSQLYGTKATPDDR